MQIAKLRDYQQAVMRHMLDHLLLALRAAGLTYSTGVVDASAGRRARLWRLQPAPFHHPEFPPKVKRARRIKLADIPNTLQHTHTPCN